MKTSNDIRNVDTHFYNPSKTEPEEYDRIVTTYIQYYNWRARRYRYAYYFFGVLKLLLLALLPISQVFLYPKQMDVVIVIVPTVIIFIESLLALFQCREKWYLFRNTCNQLSGVQRYYMATVRNEVEDKRKEYVAQVENLISDEARNWLILAEKRMEEGKKHV